MNQQRDEVVKNGLSNWNKNSDNRQKLQSSYLFISIFFLLVAGVISLINHNLGQTLMLASTVSFIIFLINSAVWALLYTFVIIPLSFSNHKTEAENYNQESEIEVPPTDQKSQKTSLKKTTSAKSKK